MSKKANPTLVGLFILGALAIAVGAIVFLGTTTLFSREKTFICFFQQSVAGLEVGSPVKFKGVPIGRVTRIQVRFDANATTYIKVLFNIDTKTVVNNLGADIDLFDEAQTRKQAERGVRATLTSESLITGVLYLELDYHPDAPPPVYLEKGDEYTEVPTLPSRMDTLMTDAAKAVTNIGKIDFAGLGKDLQHLVETADKGLSQIQFDQLNDAVKRVADSITGLVGAPETKETVAAAHAALDNLSQTLTTLRAQIDPVGKQLTPALAEMRKTLIDLQKTALQLNSALAPEGALRYKLDDTLGQVGEMAKSLQQLSEFLERNPNSLIFGRKPPANNKQP